MIVTIGIDSSTTNCGVAIFKNGILDSTKNYEFKGTYSVEKLKEIVDTFNDVFKTLSPARS